MCVEWQSAGLPTPRLRIGVASGEAVVGSLGGEQRLKFTSLGDLVNLAARLESVDLGEDAFDAGRRFRIVISERTRELIATAFATEPLGERVLKGRRAATTLHRVTGTCRD
jgi:adenylate cyclase